MTRDLSVFRDVDLLWHEKRHEGRHDDAPSQLPAALGPGCFEDRQPLPPPPFESEAEESADVNIGLSRTEAIVNVAATNLTPND